MDARLNNLSVPLYRILVKVGASERLRDLHKQTATTREILGTIDRSFSLNKLIIHHYCGSSYEGTVTPDTASDLDVIQCFNYLPVVLDVAASPPGLSYLIVCDSWTPPGYCKLQAVWNGQPQYDRHMLDPEHYGIDHAGRACLKHVKRDNMQGPAVMGFQDGVHIFDVVYAFKCETIPASSLRWIMRPRPYNFPSRDQLQQMSRLGFMFVGVGHVKSCEHELEWRLSFTLQERMLMSSFNPTQHKVYILLKLIKNNIFKGRFQEESLSSYHFKTCILYAVQMTPARAWTPFNLINCLLQCLKLMERWLRDGHCPSFLIKDQNLFTKFTKLKSSQIRRRLLEVMRFIFQGGRQFMYLLHSDNVGAMLRDGESRMFRELRVNHKSAYLFKLKEWQIRAVNYEMLPLIQRMSGGRLDPFSLTHVLDTLQQQEWRINDHTAEETYSAIEHLFPWLHLHIANGLASISVSCHDIAIKTRLDQMTESHLHEARLSDLVNTRLTKVTILYASEKYDEGHVLLQQLEHEFIFHMARYCLCTRKTVVPYRDRHDKQVRCRKLAKLSVHQIRTSHTACCVVFLPSAAAIVQAPLKYEMLRSLGTPPGSRDEEKDFWFDWAAVDARVYIYFLQYLVSSKLQRDVYRQVARDNLQAEIMRTLHFRDCERPVLFHRETAYNLLGWIYMQEGRLAEAFVCFVESLKIRPLHNAAKFHTRDLIAMVSERRRQH